MNNTTIEHDEDEIDLKEIFSTLANHKLKILFSTLLFTVLAAAYAYLQPNTYEAYTTIEVNLEKSTSMSSDDILSMAMNAQGGSADTEIEVIKSRTLISRALSNIDYTHKYYVTHLFKTTELYKTSPFNVELNKGENITFEIYPIDHQNYRLKAKGEDEASSQKWEIEKLYTFGSHIKEKYFDFTLTLNEDYPFEDEDSYSFIVLDEQESLASMRKNLSVSTTSKSSSVLRISYLDNKALRATEFTNALAKVYLAQGTERKTEEASMILSFIDQQLAGIDSKLKKSEQNLEKFKKKSNMMNLGVKAEGVVSKLSEYDGKLAEADMEEQMLRSIYKQVTSGKNISSISAAGLDMEATGVPQLIQKLQEAQLEQSILLADYTPKHPSVKKLTGSIRQFKKVIKSTIKTLKLRVAKRKKLLNATIKEYKAMMETLPEKEKIFVGLQRKFVVNEKIYSYMLEKRATTAIAKASTVNKSRVLDSALMPKKPIKPKRKLIIIIGLISGLIFGIMFAFLRELFNDKITSEEDIRKLSSITLLATIPHIKDTGKKTIKVFTSPKSVVSEAFRALRTNLQFLTGKDGGMVISLTSTVGGEGKTTMSTNLASIISLTGKKTIVLNLDMRKPTLHLLFDLPNTQGMSTLLSNKVSIADVVQKTKHNNLHIISSGPVPPNPSELIGSDAMAKVLNELKEHYDMIIIDTPPVGLVADAITLMNQSDVSLYVLRSGYSKKGYMSDMQHMQKNHQIKNLYLVLNDIKTNKKGYAYGYGYYEE